MLTLYDKDEERQKKARVGRRKELQERWEKNILKHDGIQVNFISANFVNIRANNIYF